MMMNLELFLDFISHSSLVCFRFKSLQNATLKRLSIDFEKKRNEKNGGRGFIHLIIREIFFGRLRNNDRKKNVRSSFSGRIEDP